MKDFGRLGAVLLLFIVLFCGSTLVFSEVSQKDLYNLGKLKPINSVLKVKVGEPAPEFVLPSVSGEKIALSHFLGQKNIVL
ncbi:MAG: peroxiredoxin, partial [Deltaproteobacteria bacterium]|nr:peroxiredoxin [Deltaproteobacteria bacterium]